MSVGKRARASVLRAVTATTPTLSQRVVQGLLTIASVVYGGLVRVRNAGYNSGVLRTHRLACRVVCVGNLTVGGTGKTPTVLALAGAARAAGSRVCIVLRGYGRRRHGVQVVSDGRDTRGDWREVGDEAAFLADRLPGVPVVVGEDRVAAGRLAVERFSPHVIFLDDGFQHRRLHRDADLVLVDASDPFGGGRIFPRGRLREPVAELRRAKAILLTRADEVGGLDRICQRLHDLALGRPIGRSIFRPVRLRAVGTKSGPPVTEMRGRRVLAISGIGNPESFHRTLGKLGADLVARLVYPDHHEFTDDDCRNVNEAAQRSGAEWIVTTEKDAVRLEAGVAPCRPLLAVEVALEIVEGAEEIEAAIGLAVRTRRG